MYECFVVWLGKAYIIGKWEVYIKMTPGKLPRVKEPITLLKNPQDIIDIIAAIELALNSGAVVLLIGCPL